MDNDTNVDVTVVYQTSLQSSFGSYSLHSPTWAMFARISTANRICLIVLQLFRYSSLKRGSENTTTTALTFLGHSNRPSLSIAIKWTKGAFEVSTENQTLLGSPC